MFKEQFNIGAGSSDAKRYPPEVAARRGCAALKRALKETLPGRVGREEGVGGGVAEGEDDGDVEEEERGRVRCGDVERRVFTSAS